MDRTIIYRELVRLANPHAGQENFVQAEPDAVTVEAVDTARAIRQLEDYLVSIKGPYLAAAGPNKMTDAQRAEIDQDVRQVLHREHKRIKRLEESEKRRMEKRPQGMARFFADPKVDGMSSTLDLHRRGIFVYLNDFLKRTGDLHAQQQRTRLSRQVHRVVSSQRASPVAAEPPSVPVLEPEVLQLTVQQQEQLQAESSALMEELQATLDQANKAEQSMQQIALLQSELASHLEGQTEMIQQLVDDAFKTTDDVDSANVQLRQAKARNRRASKIIIYLSLFIAIILLLYDWIL